jgi:hypothetical protein
MTLAGEEVELQDGQGQTGRSALSLDSGQDWGWDAPRALMRSLANAFRDQQASGRQAALEPDPPPPSIAHGLMVVAEVIKGRARRVRWSRRCNCRPTWCPGLLLGCQHRDCPHWLPPNRSGQRPRGLRQESIPRCIGAPYAHYRQWLALPRRKDDRAGPLV